MLVNPASITRVDDQHYSSLPNVVLDEEDEDALLAEAEALFSVFPTESFEIQLLPDTAVSIDENPPERPKMFERISKSRPTGNKLQTPGDGGCIGSKNVDRYADKYQK
ncbi:hypothetical protein PHYPSEUDO_002085 [Phytophthora pseudosyringae]|uniref:Uncharacterized protein n=1 Tax=Phytophthora pseudosyringae TaxID=221518 RepID=A0A8T1VY72_9STRA|nr:hypothetical protein PHYPSEUDO_002085 [Phytophthora pseudosyringae]